MFSNSYKSLIMPPASIDAFAAVRPTKIRFYLRRMEELGFDPLMILEGTPATPASLKKSLPVDSV
jgi:hypothetical protein